MVLKRLVIGILAAMCMSEENRTQKPTTTPTKDRHSIRSKVDRSVSCNLLVPSTQRSFLLNRAHRMRAFPILQLLSKLSLKISFLKTKTIFMCGP